MNRSIVLCVAATVSCGLLHVQARAQDRQASRQNDRPFALVFDTEPVSYNGVDMDTRASLKQYVETHAGRYIVFQQEGSLFRLDDVASVSEAERRAASLRPLEAQEHVLNEQQKPLQQKMDVLQQRMRNAQSSEQRSTIGEQMSVVGEQMGRLGQEQGAVGERIGTAASAFYQSVQLLLAKCMAHSSCHRL